MSGKTVAISATVLLGAAAATYYAYTTQPAVKKALDEALGLVEKQIEGGRTVAKRELEAISSHAAEFKAAALTKLKELQEKVATGAPLEPRITVDVGNHPEIDADTVNKLKRAVSSLLEDYLVSGDISEAIKCWGEITALVAKGCTDPNPAKHVEIVAVELVKRALYLCLDRPQRDQEVMACLISSLEVNGCLSSADIAKGFDVLIARFDDVILDAPDAAIVLAIILAHLVLDGTLPETFLVGHAAGGFRSPKVDAPLELPGSEDVKGVTQMLSYASWMLYGKIPLPLQQMKIIIRSFVQSCLLTGAFAVCATLFARHSPVLAVMRPRCVRPQASLSRFKRWWLTWDRRITTTRS